jgi:O6-methylguanine-DNA--protein-cysteine methyltransferase
MRCRSALTRIDAMRTGELPAPESSEVHQHLKKCQSCDESVGDLAALTSTLKKLVVAPPQSIRDAIADHFDAIDAGGEHVLVAFSDRGLRMITRGADPDQFREAYARRFGRELAPATLPERLRKQVVAALSGEGVDKPAVDFADAGEFERKVLEILTRIPRGQVRTYTWVANQAGRPKAVLRAQRRAVRRPVPSRRSCERRRRQLRLRRSGQT